MSLLGRLLADRSQRRDTSRQYTRVLSELDLPDAPSVEELCDAVARRRGRPLYRQEANLPSGISGIWVEHEQFDMVVYPAGTARWHQMLIMLHELWHVLCDHEPHEAGNLTSLLTPLLDPDAMRQLRGVWKRGVGGGDDERWAELLASWQMSRCADWNPPPRRADPLPPEAAEIISRMEQALRG